MDFVRVVLMIVEFFPGVAAVPFDIAVSVGADAVALLLFTVVDLRDGGFRPWGFWIAQERAQRFSF